MGRLLNKLMYILLVLVLVVGSINTGSLVSDAATKFKLTDTSIVIASGTEYAIYLMPVKLDGSIKWETSKKSIATVKNGVIKAKKAGSCVVSAIYKKRVYRCRVTVQNIKPVILGNYVDNQSNRIQIKNGYKIEFAGGSIKSKLNIENCYKDKGFNIWYTVNYNDGGECNRLFKLTKPSGYKNLEVYNIADNSTTKIDLLNTYVKEETIQDIIGFSSNDVTIQKGYSAKLSVINAGYKVGNFKSSNKRIVSVDKEGRIRAKRTGRVKITAKVDRYKIACIVNVSDKLQDKVKGRWVTSGSDIVQIWKSSNKLVFYSGGSKDKTTGKIYNIYQDRYGNIIVAANIKQKLLIDGKYLSVNKKVKYKVYKSKRYNRLTVYSLINGIYTREYYGHRTKLSSVN